MNPLPPQAYTKDTLVEAYAWLQSQNDSIKEIATTPDILVSLYMKAKMQGMEALERPSIQNFKTELKSLVGIMGEFEIKEHKQVTQVTASKMSFEPLRTDLSRHENLKTDTHTHSEISKNESSYKSSFPNLEPKTIDVSASKSFLSTPATAPTINSNDNSGTSKELNSNKSLVTSEIKAETSDTTCAFKLDSKSLSKIKETKEQFNLSSDEEALRMIIAAGFQQISRMWK